MKLGLLSCTKFPLEVNIFEHRFSDTFETIVFTDLQSFEEFRNDSRYFYYSIFCMQVHKLDTCVYCYKKED